jgi:DNA ligase-1
MPDLQDGETFEMQGSGSKPYVLKNVGGVYSCSCPAWRNQSLAIEKRTCKHLRKLRGDAAEEARVGEALPERAKKEKDKEGSEPPLLLAETWDFATDPAGWWLSEKLDGVRAYWDGTRFISRLGNQFFAPTWFTAHFPKVPLDGELWGGRKLFQKTVGIVKRQDESAAWKELKYVVFDAPSHGGVFEERVAFIEETVGRLGIEWLEACEHARCESVDQLKAELARVEALGGEGLMCRQPKSPYVAGRSSTLLKVKSFHDTEARIVDHVAGMGKHKGRLGSLLVELPDGTRFNVGTGFSDRERDDPPPIGAIITFRYQELSNTGVPRFPSYVGVRIDGTFPTSSAPARTVPAVATPKPAASHRAPAMTSTPTAGARSFEFTEGASSKFWEIRVEGSSFTTRYGKIGTPGQQTTKTFASDARAQAEADKLIAEKVKKGYVER